MLTGPEVLSRKLSTAIPEKAGKISNGLTGKTSTRFFVDVLTFFCSEIKFQDEKVKKNRKTVRTVESIRISWYFSSV